MVVAPISTSWSAVLTCKMRQLKPLVRDSEATLLISVGRTSAEGIEKSQ